MDKKEILSKVDHTLLAQTATWEEIKQILDDGMKYETASACIPAAYVKQAAEYVQGKLPICTVIGFPNGYATTAAKVFMAKDAVANGAAEVDMVINIGWLKDGRYDEVEEEIRQVHAACGGKLLKVIIETCLLTDEEKIKCCELVTKAGAEYIKTSTGFSKAGARGIPRRRRPGSGAASGTGPRESGLPNGPRHDGSEAARSPSAMDARRDVGRHRLLAGFRA